MNKWYSIELFGAIDFKRYEIRIERYINIGVLDICLVHDAW